MFATASILFASLAFSPTADAEFGGKIKNIRIREGGSGAGYRVSTVSTDDDVTSTEELSTVVLDFYDPECMDCGILNTIKYNVGDVRRIVERFTATGLAFDGDPIGTTYFLSLTVYDADGGTLGVIDAVEVSPTDPGATDADDGASSDGGWLTDAGKIELAKTSASVSVGIKEQSSGEYKLVVKIKGDDGLADLSVGSIEVQFNEPFEGPAPKENVISVTPAKTKTRTVQKAVDYDPSAPTPKVDYWRVYVSGYNEASESVFTSDSYYASPIGGGPITGYGDILLTGEPIGIE